MTETVKIKLVVEGAKMPSQQTSGSAGYDVYLPEETMLLPHARHRIPLGFTMAMPDGMYARLKSRSGFTAKGMEDAWGIRHNADVMEGTIDSDYRGEVCVTIANHEDGSVTLPAGIRIAQLIFEHYESPELTAVEALDETERKGGHGSTGKF